MRAFAVEHGRQVVADDLAAERHRARVQDAALAAHGMQVVQVEGRGRLPLVDDEFEHGAALDAHLRDGVREIRLGALTDERQHDSGLALGPRVDDEARMRHHRTVAGQRRDDHLDGRAQHGAFRNQDVHTVFEEGGVQGRKRQARDVEVERDVARRRMVGLETARQPFDHHAERQRAVGREGLVEAAVHNDRRGGAVADFVGGGERFGAFRVRRGELEGGRGDRSDVREAPGFLARRRKAGRLEVFEGVAAMQREPLGRARAEAALAVADPVEGLGRARHWRAPAAAASIQP